MIQPSPNLVETVIIGHFTAKGVDKASFLVNGMVKTHMFSFDIFFYLLLTS